MWQHVPAAVLKEQATAGGTTSAPACTRPHLPQCIAPRRLHLLAGRQQDVERVLARKGVLTAQRDGDGVGLAGRLPASRQRRRQLRLDLETGAHNAGCRACNTAANTCRTPQCTFADSSGMTPCRRLACNCGRRMGLSCPGRHTGTLKRGLTHLYNVLARGKVKEVRALRCKETRELISRVNLWSTCGQHTMAATTAMAADDDVQRAHSPSGQSSAPSVHPSRHGSVSATCLPTAGRGSRLGMCERGAPREPESDSHILRMPNVCVLPDQGASRGRKP